MAEKMQIKAVDMVRRIRDDQAQVLAGKSKADIIAFFAKAGKAARQKAGGGQHAKSRPSADD